MKILKIEILNYWQLNHYNLNIVLKKKITLEIGFPIGVKVYFLLLDTKAPNIITNAMNSIGNGTPVLCIGIVPTSV
jgi:hypothetical protein